MKYRIPRASTGLEKSLFEIICLIIVLIMLHGMIQGFWLYGISTMVLVEAAAIVIFGTFFFLSRYKGLFNHLRIPLMALCLLVLIYFWISLSGIYGPSGIGAVAVGIICIIFLPPRFRNFFLVLIMSILVGLVIIQLKTDWIVQAPQSNETLPYDYLVVLFGTFLMVNYLKMEFDKERKRARSQNSELEQLNFSFRQNIKEKERIIKNLTRTQNQLIESEKMASLGHFTAGIAHEINNPLNFVGGSIQPIKNNIDALKNQINGSQLESVKEELVELNMLLDNVERGTKHIEDILSNLIKITPKNDPSESSTDFNLQEVVLDTYYLVKHASSHISFDLQAEQPINYHGLPLEFNQCLLNLLRNSIDAVEEVSNPSINVQLFQKEDKIKIKVQDNGIGVPKKIQNKIFDPFFTTKAPGKGTGVGLYIVYTIVKKYGGTIEVESKEAAGTTIEISLPVI
ncbi:sensor histidine kinase [Marinoscillum sp. MHG1-6]|uniref:sensor histidine kinase n=1 Tax=Marinoscillum sp. MHG1-6 TaxID=2959627 RepID=UPI0021583B55|nr:ATP-binding protein [Marinoscillum sp. MHG1-6]